MPSATGPQLEFWYGEESYWLRYGTSRMKLSVSVEPSIVRSPSAGSVWPGGGGGGTWPGASGGVGDGEKVGVVLGLGSIGGVGVADDRGIGVGVAAIPGVDVDTFVGDSVGERVGDPVGRRVAVGVRVVVELGVIDPMAVVVGVDVTVAVRVAVLDAVTEAATVPVAVAFEVAVAVGVVDMNGVVVAVGVVVPIGAVWVTVGDADNWGTVVRVRVGTCADLVGVAIRVGAPDARTVVAEKNVVIAMRPRVSATFQAHRPTERLFCR